MNLIKRLLHRGQTTECHHTPIVHTAIPAVTTDVDPSAATTQVAGDPTAVAVEAVIDNGFNVRDEFKSLTVEELRAEQASRTAPYAVAAFNIKGNLNTSNLIRSACLFGAERFFVVGDGRYDRRGCVGAQNYVDLHYIMDADALFDRCKEYDYTPVAIEQGGADISHFKHFKYIRRPLIILGSESNGLPQEVIDRCHSMLSIPQLGVMRSLNVAAAGSIIMYKAMTEITSY